MIPLAEWGASTAWPPMPCGSVATSLWWSDCVDKITMTEATRLLGVKRPCVSKWLASGKLTRLSPKAAHPQWLSRQEVLTLKNARATP